jgi:hypothetical protein
MLPVPLSANPTAQDVFDTIVRHAASMPGRSMLGGSRFCSYRTSEGNACFVGCMLTDSQAQEGDRLTRSGGGGGVGTLADRKLLPEALLPHLSLLAAVQPIHDEYEPEDWPCELRNIALEGGLSTAVLDEAFAAR